MTNFDFEQMGMQIIPVLTQGFLPNLCFRNGSNAKVLFHLLVSKNSFDIIYKISTHTESVHTSRVVKKYPSSNNPNWTVSDLPTLERVVLLLNM